jgi:hypothetical protein
MPSSITFDTHTYVKELKAAGFTEDQAEVQAKALQTALSDFQSLKLQELATKSDLEKVKGEMIKWFAAMILAQTAVYVALIKLLA